MDDIQITKNTSVSLSVVVVLITAAVAYGVLTAKVNNIENDVDDIHETLVNLDDKFESLLGTRIMSFID